MGVKQFFNPRGFLKKMATETSTKLVKEKDLLALAKRTSFGALAGASFGGAVGYQNAFLFGAYDHWQEGKTLDWSKATELEGFARQEAYRGVIIGLASGALTRGLLPFHRVNAAASSNMGAESTIYPSGCFTNALLQDILSKVGFKI